MKRIIIVLILLSTMFALPVDASVKIGDEVNINGINATVVDFKNGQPVYQALITPNIHSTASDGYLWNLENGGVYNTARTAVNADAKDDTGGWMLISNSLNAGWWLIYRGYLYFDTSSLNGFVVTAADLKLWGSVGVSGDVDTDTLVIQDGMPTYPHDPLVVGDFDESQYAGNYASKTFATWTASAYNTLSLNAGGVAAINTSGTTKFCLRTDHDINNNQPTGTNALWITTTEQGDPYEPTLIVTFTALTPSVVSVAASAIGSTTARLNSTVSYDGGDITCQIEFGYGAVSKTAVNYAAYTNHVSVTVPLADYKTGDNPYLDIAGLGAGATYYYRVKITNELSGIVSTDEQTFTTIGTVDDMTQLLGYPNDISISTSWAKANGATDTLIRYRTDTYPTTTADGTQAYLGTGTSFVVTGLTEGTTYYFSAWGKSGATYSTNEVNMVMTTNSKITESTLPAGSTPGGWMQDPDATLLVNFQPVYSVINGLADNFGMPRGNAWLALSMLFILFTGVGLYIRFGSPSLALFIMAIVMGLFVMLHIIGYFFIVLTLMLALGGWATRPGATS
jgi:hypothetical protein